MTQRQINRMSDHERSELLRDLARDINSRLNLFGVDDEPISGLLDPVATEREIEYRLGEIMRPECSCRKGDSSCQHNHGFPPWFMRLAQPAATAFLRAWRQVDRAPARS